MCGLAGFIDAAGSDAPVARATLSRMTGALAHRGPDDSGEFVDPVAGIAIGHRRLSIIDLSAAGHQPMESASGRFVLAYNGEIYNHLDLRARLDGVAWRGHSDTETLLAAVEAWGFEKALQACVGMFAIAMWDRQTRTLSLARDRLGEKPLYYGEQNGVFFFASELKALRAHPKFSAMIDRQALASYVRTGYVPTPLSIYSGIRKLPQGTRLEVPVCAGSRPLTPRPYWSLRSVIEQGSLRRFAGTPTEAVDELERVVQSAVRGQQLADVPLGAFLSGGTDSSLIVAMMQVGARRPARTFTIGFEEASHDEARYAAQVARHLGTEHTQMVATARDALDLVPELSRIYDEPFADMSQIPTLLVSRLARRHVTVALSGDAGDELFCGYGHYPANPRRWRRLSMIPTPLRRVGRFLAPDAALREAMTCRDFDEFYRFMNSQWKGHPDLVPGVPAVPLPVPVPAVLADPTERMMYVDAMTYLSDDILVKVDRAAMSASLETRVPLLDHRVVEFAWSLPLEYKYRDGVAKWPLKQVLYRHVPRELLDRPKGGFGVPMDRWLRGPLREWAEALLAEDRLRREGFFDVRAVRAQLATHLGGGKDRQYALWTLLMFQAWHESNQSSMPVAAQRDVA
jgi:asparagine synthase (glutamine-hydrolysing)